MDVGSIALKTLYASCSIFVAQEVDHSFVLTDAMIKEHEEKFGPVAPQSWFLVMTGWSKKCNNQQAYQNVDTFGKMHFPKISPDAADYLVKKNILGLGIDTLSPDGDDPTFPVHKKLLGSGKFIVENLVYHPYACSNQCFLQVTPLAIVGGTESPVRVLLVKQEN
jgi:kynurenine formamidase